MLLFIGLFWLLLAVIDLAIGAEDIIFWSHIVIANVFIAANGVVKKIDEKNDEK